MNFYTIMAKMYDVLEVTYFANKSPRTVINKLISSEKVKVLDLCCGTMANSIPLARSKRNIKVIGIDLSNQMLRIAKKKAERNNISNVYIKCVDATNTNIDNNFFDYIILGLALHEMKPELQKRVLEEAHRLLKPNGELIVLEWERERKFWKKVVFAPLLVLEQILNSSFYEFYKCNKVVFFKENGFEVKKMVHCDYSVVIMMKKC